MDFQSLKLKLKMNFSIVIFLMAVNIFLFIITLVFSQLFGSSIALVLLGAEYLPDILAGQVWRVITASFLHAGIFHLLVNMWALYHLGGAIETFYGQKKTIMVYVFTGISGSLLSIAFTLYQIYAGNITTGFPLSVGASGAIFGFVGLIIGNKFKKNTYSVSIDNYINTSQLWFFLGLNILFGFGVNFLGTGFGINNFAHIGGFLGGLILGSFLDMINTTYQSKYKSIIENLMFFFSVIILVLAFLAQIIYIVLSYRI